MSRELFGLELGMNVYAENGDVLYAVIGGTAAPDGVSGKQGSSPIGSLYVRSGTGELYQKIANAGAPADWQLNGASQASIGNWRPENVRLVTSDTQGAGTRDVVANPFSDDDAPNTPVGFYTVGDYIISGSLSTSVLLEITNVVGDDVTFAVASDPLNDNDTFLTKLYLPDSPNDQEVQAIVIYNSGNTQMTKIGDVNWDLATGINLSSGFLAANGTPAIGDSVEVALEKLTGNQDDLQTLQGVAQGSTTMGSYTGATLSDATQKVNLQELETAHEEVDANVDDLISLSGVAENSSVFGAFLSPGSFLLGASETMKSALQKLADYLFGLKVTQTVGVTTAAAVDSLAHATYKRVVWHVEVFETATPANAEGFTIEAITDGTNVDDTTYAKLRLAKINGLTAAAVINGANLELQIGATASCTVNVRRLTVI